MGFVTTGKPLTENHPFFRTLTNSADPDIRPQVARHILGPSALNGDSEEDDGDQDDEEFVPATEHIGDSEGEDEKSETDDESFENALEDVQ